MMLTYAKLIGVIGLWTLALEACQGAPPTELSPTGFFLFGLGAVLALHAVFNTLPPREDTRGDQYP